MNYGETLIKGKLKNEILFSTYICHPSMVNNELSGPVISAALISYINSLKNLKYSYRFLFVPETIGSIAYISKNLKKLKNDTLAGFVINCAGDDRDYSFVQTPQKNTFADEIMKSSFIGLKKEQFMNLKTDRPMKDNIALRVLSFQFVVFLEVRRAVKHFQNIIQILTILNW